MRLQEAFQMTEVDDDEIRLYLRDTLIPELESMVNVPDVDELEILALELLDTIGRKRQ